MANAYATIANGIPANVHVISKVVNRTGETPGLRRRHTDALDPDINADVSYAMQQVVEEGTAGGVALDRPAAGKTGTVTNDRTRSPPPGSWASRPALHGRHVRPRAATTTGRPAAHALVAYPRTRGPRS